MIASISIVKLEAALSSWVEVEAIQHSQSQVEAAVKMHACPVLPQWGTTDAEIRNPLVGAQGSF